MLSGDIRSGPLSVLPESQTLRIERDRVDVHPTLATRGNLDAYWKPVRLDGIAKIADSGHAGLIVGGIYRKIQVTMRSGL